MVSRKVPSFLLKYPRMVPLISNYFFSQKLIAIRMLAGGINKSIAIEASELKDWFELSQKRETWMRSIHNSSLFEW